jgi:hypothetical protein
MGLRDRAVIGTNLPHLLDPARAAFDAMKPALLQYAEERISFDEFKARLPGPAPD